MSAADIQIMPAHGGITVGATTANTATASIDLGAAAVGSIVTLTCDDGAGNATAFYVSFNSAAITTPPDPTATSGNARCVVQPTGRVDFTVTGDCRFIRLYPKATGYYRAFVSSPK